MINAIANISLNQMERASTDEFERDILTKASAITLTPITFLELIVAAILAWSLPGRLSLLAPSPSSLPSPARPSAPPGCAGTSPPPPAAPTGL